MGIKQCRKCIIVVVAIYWEEIKLNDCVIGEADFVHAHARTLLIVKLTVFLQWMSSTDDDDGCLHSENDRMRTPSPTVAPDRTRAHSDPQSCALITGSVYR
jgi:hypothetical protein